MNKQIKKVKCMHCYGNGKIVWVGGVLHVCPVCKGRGFVTVERSYGTK
jgi:DnaJ-class molecular chaperone